MNIEKIFAIEVNIPKVDKLKWVVIPATDIEAARDMVFDNVSAGTVIGQAREATPAEEAACIRAIVGSYQGAA